MITLADLRQARERIHGVAVRTPLLPYEAAKRQLDLLHPTEVHVLHGRGYDVAWEAPHELNPIIESFLARHTAHPKTHMRAS